MLIEANILNVIANLPEGLSRCMFYTQKYININVVTQLYIYICMQTSINCSFHNINKSNKTLIYNKVFAEIVITNVDRTHFLIGKKTSLQEICLVYIM